MQRGKDLEIKARDIYMENYKCEVENDVFLE